MKWHSNQLAANALNDDGFGATYAPPSQQHLVVESRTDDRWRVELCTTLDDLDNALDTAKALRADGGIDEVCLTLETTGANGREVRREILRLGTEEAASMHSPAPAAAMPAVSGASEDPSYDEFLNAILPAIKLPDYEIDEDVLNALTPRPALNTPEWREDIPSESAEPRETASPVYGTDNAPSEEEARAAARALVNSLYGLHNDVEEPNEPPAIRRADAEDVIDLSDVLPTSPNADRREDDDISPSVASGADANGDSDANWVDGIEVASHRRFVSSGRLEADEDRIDAAERLERPLIGDPSGAASKAFIVAGTLAMMVLGGAIAELLTINLTTPAMADQTSVSLSENQR